MINTPVSLPVCQIYLRGDDNEGPRSKHAFSLLNGNGRFFFFFFLLSVSIQVLGSKEDR